VGDSPDGQGTRRRVGIDGAGSAAGTAVDDQPGGSSTIARGVTFRTASRVALVVGTILTLVNQGAIMMDGDSTVGTWVRVGVNYLVPYLVSSVGYIAPFRMRS